MKKNNTHVAAFYADTLLLIVVFVGILILLVQVFGLGKQRSAEAKLLTTAVALAENTAEAASAASPPFTQVSRYESTARRSRFSACPATAAR